MLGRMLYLLALEVVDSATEGLSAVQFIFDDIAHIETEQLTFWSCA